MTTSLAGAAAIAALVAVSIGDAPAPQDRSAAAMTRIGVAAARDSRKARVPAAAPPGAHADARTVQKAPFEAGHWRRALLHVDAARREELVDELGDLHHPDTVALLESALLDVDPSVREAAVAALAQVDDCAALPALARALDDSEPAVRLDALYAIADMGTVAAAALLSRTLSDEQDDVRVTALELLEEPKISGRFAARCD